jgi:hypothetical protein
MQKIAIALSSHARPQALDEASYSPKPDFWKGLEASQVGPSGTQPIPQWAMVRYRGSAAGRVTMQVVSECEDVGQ